VRILWLTTKPPWPPSDGGRLLQVVTLDGLDERGALVKVVAPVEAGTMGGETPEEASRGGEASGGRHELVRVEVRRKGALGFALAARPGGLPLAIARHRHREMLDEVERSLAAEPFDLVHVEQVHALCHAAPALERRLPVVLRAQNVESDLWRGGSRLLPLRGALLTVEVLRLRRWEGRAVRRATRVTALTASDASRLERLAGLPPGGVEVLAPPFPAALPASGTRLDGEPPVVLFGSSWLPNRDAAEWFRWQVWPAVRHRLPGARLHWFGGAPQAAAGEGGIEVHPAPAESAKAFAPGAILVLPLRLGSGVRMRILEAWARGTPVVATPAAAAGLAAEDGGNLLLASSAEAFAGALAGLAGDPARVAALAAAGRRTLAAHHDPAAVTGQLLGLYERATADRRVNRRR
jgi:hypothetical protein